MNRLEFNEILKTLGINNHLINTTGRYGSSEAVHFWNNIAIYFGGSYYTVIRGKVPLEVANIIYEKYPNNPHEIRIDGGCSDYIPIEHATDDQYKKEIQEHIEQHLGADEYLARCKKSRRNMLRRKNENKYIETYHIDSKEGLIILLTELKDYYARKQGLRETEVQRYDEIISTISAEILKKVNPSITTYDWMGADEQYGENFLNTIARDKQTPFGHAFREIVDQFDRTINPYINEDIELDSINNYLQKVNISANTYNEEDGKYRKNCCRMTIKAKDGESEVRYYRSPNCFSYQLRYVLGPKEYLTVLHYFDNKGDKESDKGEHIYINYFGENSKQEIDLRYNITQGLSGETYKDKTPITPEQMTFVYDELVKAIELASTITIDNMQKKGYSKKLVSDKK